MTDNKECQSSEAAEDIFEKQTDENEPVHAQVLQLQEKNLRLLADLENLRKRMQKEKQDAVRFAVENTIVDLVPIIDNFEQALHFSSQAAPEVQQWASGFQMFLTQLKELLHNHDIVAFHSEGNQFDPHFHEAMEIVETNEVPENTILEELAKGYKSPHRTIRPAKVKVAKRKLECELEEDQEKKGES
jgi:molecular chaperone GrpE